ncbi:hypothetical protein F4778DRAFT_783871 [Xylariomycetidae sp. FL2044]|nr:hypothetical protein F4778DRAFT_783871 [Xylariomycetidae sp. FL2044]
MKYIAFLLVQASFANMLKLDIEARDDTPSCASRCMVNSMFVTQCIDMNCLCHKKDYQQSLFQCLYSQCDSDEYGSALSFTISLCMSKGAEIYMVAPGGINEETLKAREDDYLAGRQLAEVPGLQLRQESVGLVPTVTTTTTTCITVRATDPPSPTPFFESNLPDPTATSMNRPWMVTASGAGHTRTSYAGLVLWIIFVLFQDYRINGY